MFVTLRGTAKKRFAQEAWLNGHPIREMWQDGVKLFPDDRTRVKGISLSTVDVEIPYWLHAVYLAKQGSNDAQHLLLTFNNKTYCLYSQYMDYPLLTPQSGLYFTFAEDEGILLSDVLDGTTATITAVMPEHQGERFFPQNNGVWDVKGNGQWHTWELPLLPDTIVRLNSNKGKKREHSYVNLVNIVGLESGYYYARNRSDMRGSKGRYEWSFDIPIKAYTYNAFGKDDIRWKGTANNYGKGSGWKKGMYPIYPAFNKTWTAKIVGATLQTKK